MRNKMVQFTNHNGRENGQCCTNGVNGGSGTTIQYNNGTNGRHTNPVAAETRTGTQQGLPINRVRKRIIKLLKSDAPTMIFVGETASGKSTQIPQMCLEAGLAYDGKRIAVTQPRRLAAQTLAQRVAQEMGTTVGQLVGYKYRFEDVSSPETQIIYLTDGMILREALQDAVLSNYSVVIIDEAHERSIHTDVLMLVLKLVQKSRTNTSLGPIRLILMSATIETSKFAAYFNNAPSYYVKGRPYKVRMFHTTQEYALTQQYDYLTEALTVVCNLHESEPLESGFLVFLTGREEIEVAVRTVNRLFDRTNPQVVAASYGPIDAIPLYASLPNHVQSRAFQPSIHGKRKIVFATNIAETSVTIPGICVVIDPGKVKQKVFSPQNRVDVLRVVSISKEQAIQRSGRAGRLAEGKCYRLYSEADFQRLVSEQPPEIQRSNLASVVLELVSLGMKKHTLSVLDPPASDSLEAAVNDLIGLGAITQNQRKLLAMTELGKSLVKFPVDPAHALILFQAVNLGCLEEALTTVAFVSSEPILNASHSDLLVSLNDAWEPEPHVILGVDENKSFYSPEGDHVMLLKYYRQYISQKQKLRSNAEKLKEWCKLHQVNKSRLENVLKVRKQLEDICEQLHWDVKSTCRSNLTLLRQAICRGLIANACVLDVRPHQTHSNARYCLCRQPQFLVKIHPSSCLAGQIPRAFVFTELVQTDNQIYARGICSVEEEWLIDMRASPARLSLLHSSASNGSDRNVTPRAKKRALRENGHGASRPTSAASSVTSCDDGTLPNTPAAGNNNRPTMLNFDTPQSADSTNKHNNGGIMVEPPSPLSNKPPQQNTPTSSTSITTTSALSNTSKTAQSAERKTAMTAPSKNKKIKLNKSVVIQTKSLVNYDVSSTSEDESDNRGDNKTPPTPELTPFVARF